MSDVIKTQSLYNQRWDSDPTQNNTSPAITVTFPGQVNVTGGCYAYFLETGSTPARPIEKVAFYNSTGQYQGQQHGQVSASVTNGAYLLARSTAYTAFIKFRDGNSCTFSFTTA